MRTRLRSAGHTVDRLRPQPRPRGRRQPRGDWSSSCRRPRSSWVMVPAGDPTRRPSAELGEPARRRRPRRRRRQLQVDRRPGERRDAGARRASASSTAASPAGSGACENGYAPDVRRRRRGRRQGPAGLRRAQARGGRLRARRQEAGRRPLRQDGPQRHRVRHHADATPRAGSCWRRSTWSTTSPSVFDSWRAGTVIRSWLLDLLVAALEEDPHLDKIAGYAEDSGEGRWTVEAAIDHAVPMNVIAASLFAASPRARTTARR